MKKFKFRLQTVLEIRQKELENQQILLAKLLSLLESQKQALNEMKDAKLALEKELEIMLAADTLELDAICNYRAFLDRALENVVAQEKLIESTNVQIQKRQEKVTGAYKAFKALDRLKEVQKKLHYGAFEAYQVKEIDDLVTSRYASAV